MQRPRLGARGTARLRRRLPALGHDVRRPRDRRPAGLRRLRRGDAVEGGATARPVGGRAADDPRADPAHRSRAGGCAASSRRPRPRTCSTRRSRRTRRRWRCTCVRDGRDVVCSLLERGWLNAGTDGRDDARLAYGARAALLGRARAARGVRAGERRAALRVGVAALRRGRARRRRRRPSARDPLRGASRAWPTSSPAFLDADVTATHRALDDFRDSVDRPLAQGADAGAGRRRRGRSRPAPRRAGLRAVRRRVLSAGRPLRADEGHRVMHRARPCPAEGPLDQLLLAGTRTPAAPHEQSTRRVERSSCLRRQLPGFDAFSAAVTDDDAVSLDGRGRPPSSRKPRIRPRQRCRLGLRPSLASCIAEVVTLDPSWSAQRAAGLARKPSPGDRTRVGRVGGARTPVDRIVARARGRRSDR